MRHNRGRTGAIVVGVAVVALGCGGDDARSADTTTRAAGGDVVPSVLTRVRVADVTASPEKFGGRTVTVEGKVDELLSPFAFELDDDSPDDDARDDDGRDDDLNVAYPRSLELLPLDSSWIDQNVRVTGTVRRLSVAELERELGWDLTPRLKVELTHQPLLIARSVQRIGPR
jgi:hypothetical protein